ncbi:MAG: MaoC family dehydratase N-terminal domain-containing protein [Propionibacteriaceae bacterium]|nr:MaoC family dehydratase N-terminal domain-containing protein [Propionibacteriaceae bacterium]
MPITDAHVGRTYPATAPYPVTAGKIAEFADALGDDNPAYRGPDAVAPPTFAIVVAFDAWEALFADPELDISLSRLIHGDQRFDIVRPLRAGDEVVSVLGIDKVRARGNSAFITVSVRIETTAGEPVATSTSTLLHTWPKEESA